MDRIKVRKGLEEAICVMDAHVPERYWGFARQACCDAIALLKEQEPKQAIKQTCHILVEGGYENPVVFTSYDLLCPTCKSLLCRGVDVIDDNYHYCKVCGQAVKWDEPPKEEEDE